MYISLFLLLSLNVALHGKLNSHSVRYFASRNVIHFNEESYSNSNVTITPVTYYDVTTLNECALKSLMVHRSSFFYSNEEQTCVLTGRIPPDTFSSVYQHYISDNKEKNPKNCYYEKLRKQESKYSEAKFIIGHGHTFLLSGIEEIMRNANSTHKQKWDRRKCRLKGGYVLEINSKDENDFVKGLFKGASIWLGAVQILENNTFRWERSGEMSFTDWSDDYPITSNTLYNYCVISTWSGWKNVYCNFQQFYVVCEFDICVE